MVFHHKTPILNCFYHLLWFYVLTDPEFSCLAMLLRSSDPEVAPEEHPSWLLRSKSF